MNKNKSIGIQKGNCKKQSLICQEFYKSTKTSKINNTLKKNYNQKLCKDKAKLMIKKENKNK